MKATSFVLAAAAVALATSATTSHAHENHRHTPDPSRLEPATILELEAVRRASARFHDVDQALAEGYVDIGLFMPNMGWHYMKQDNVDASFELDEPELLVYVDDPCSSKRKLVAVEYAVPFELSKRAPKGFTGRADVWDPNQQFRLWTLHAWVWEYNPAGVFAPHNTRVP
jgi:hypothetical protein